MVRDLRFFVLVFANDLSYFLGEDDGIHLMISPSDGKMTGEAYIELSTQEDVEKALECDRQNIDRRYIEGNNKVTNLAVCSTSVHLFQCLKWRPTVNSSMQ
jgi:RNA recognition motif-containing protein